KAWIVNHHICSKATWTLMIYDFPESEAKTWQSLVQQYYRKWIGLNATMEPSILYRSSNHFGLNFKDLRMILKQSQVIRWHILKYAKDPVSRKLYSYRLSQGQAGHIGKGRKFAPSLELESMEGQLVTKEIVGNAQIGTRGIGLRPHKKQSKGKAQRACEINER